jgi:hypothetical protein
LHKVTFILVTSLVIGTLLVIAVAPKASGWHQGDIGINLGAPHGGASTPRLLGTGKAP